MNIANEVSALESEVESLKAENDSLTRTRDMLELDNESLRKMNARLSAERDAALETATRMKVILDQAGASIVNGMQEFRAVQRKASPERLRIQEEALTDLPMPRFLERAAE